MADLLRLVTKTICSMPASMASSTAYCTTGRSTIVSISFGIAFVAGRKRVPLPATGMTAFLTLLVRSMALSFVRVRASAHAGECCRGSGSGFVSAPEKRRKTFQARDDRHAQMPDRAGIAEGVLDDADGGF